MVKHEHDSHFIRLVGFASQGCPLQIMSCNNYYNPTVQGSFKGSNNGLGLLPHTVRYDYNIVHNLSRLRFTTPELLKLFQNYAQMFRNSHSIMLIIVSLIKI